MIQHNAVLAVKVLLHGVERLLDKSVLKAYAGHGTPSLTLDKYLALLVFVTADLVAVIIVGAKKPLAVPSVLPDSLLHGIDTCLRAIGLVIKSETATELHILLTVNDKLAGYHERLGLAALSLVLGCLKRLIRIVGEAVQVKTVVPVGTTNKRQSVRSEIIHNMVERHPKVLHQRHF